VVVVDEEQEGMAIGLGVDDPEAIEEDEEEEPAAEE
jgi:hypothetical protein